MTLASSAVEKAEIRWGVDTVVEGKSNKQIANISTFFEVMSSDCRTTKLFSLGAYKLRYQCNYVLALYFCLTQKSPEIRNLNYFIWRKLPRFK